MGDGWDEVAEGSISAVSERAYRFVPPAQGERAGTALCLSGGGYRAALFHLGGPWRLNEPGILGEIDVMSSVSGGSIASGALAAEFPGFASGRVGTDDG